LRTPSDADSFRCYACGQWKQAAEFSFSDIRRQVLSSACRECHAAARRAHYLANKSDYVRRAIAQNKAKRARNRTEILAYLSTHPCIDCGNADPVVLEFDHRDPATKLTEVSRLIVKTPWSRVLAEITKCDVRCINCHRRKTGREFGWAKSSTPIE
jgi:hypothetical protein